MKVAGRLSGRGGAGGGPTDREKGGAERGLAPGVVADLDAVLASLHDEVVDRLDVASLRHLEPAQLRERVSQLVRQLLQSRHTVLSERQQDQITTSIVDEITGLGPLEPLLADPSVSDILVNTFAAVFVERGGNLERTNVRFRDNEHLIHTINRIVGRVGRRIDEASPMVDARLPDGSRVNAIIPPLALDGPLLSIRRFGKHLVSVKELHQHGSLTRNMALYLKSAVRARCNILISGGTGAGKTTLLNALSGFIPSRERIVTIEDSAELKLQQEHVARLETRPPNIEGKGEIGIRELVRNALRMRPDRIIVGEVRGAEVLDMVQAMNTGHEGSLATIHANAPSDVSTRLLSMFGFAATNISEPMVLQMVARAIHLVVQVSRMTDGRRRVTSISEVAGIKNGEMALNEVFSYEQWGVDPNGRVQGDFACSGHSILAARFRAAGVPFDLEEGGPPR
ncbi:MAG: CpaF family protein [Deltaproteobacteria bacterium]|nr:CpaF family protein [Deltaproteobacteria bacterium]